MPSLFPSSRSGKPGRKGGVPSRGCDDDGEPITTCAALMAAVAERDWQSLAYNLDYTHTTAFRSCFDKSTGGNIECEGWSRPYLMSRVHEGDPELDFIEQNFTGTLDLNYFIWIYVFPEADKFRCTGSIVNNGPYDAIFGVLQCIGNITGQSQLDVIAAGEPWPGGSGIPAGSHPPFTLAQASFSNSELNTVDDLNGGTLFSGNQGGFPIPGRCLPDDTGLYLWF